MEQNNPVIQLPSNPKPNNFLVTLLSILLLLSCVIAGYFAYQTQNLVKELQGIRNQNPATPTPTTTTDPTADWKTYTNEKYGFYLKYPSSFQVLTDEKSLYGWPQGIALVYNGGQSYDLPIEIWDSEIDYKTKYKSDYEITVHKTITGKFITLTNQNHNFEVAGIISTFKFTGSEPASCAMEAKLCPDGSSVGRSGPNCEFATCPTTSPQL